MNATSTKKQRTPEQRAKDAERARERRAAAKAAKLLAEGKVIPASEWQVVVIDGTEVKVAASLAPTEAEATARKLLGAKAEVAAAQAEEAAAVAKPERPARQRATSRNTGQKRVYVQMAQFKRIEQDAEWRKANAAAWKSLSTDAKRYDQAKDGKVYHTYFSLLTSTANAALIEAHIKAHKAAKR
jgi:hypothetical protein